MFGLVAQAPGGTLIYKADLINEVILLLDARYQVIDAFAVDGKTEHDTEVLAEWYVYRSQLTASGACVLCGASPDKIHEPCVSSGGFHAFCGVADDPSIPEGHKVENRSVAVHMLTFDEFQFYIEADNVFSADEIIQPMIV